MYSWEDATTKQALLDEDLIPTETGNQPQEHIPAEPQSNRTERVFTTLQGLPVELLDLTRQPKNWVISRDQLLRNIAHYFSTPDGENNLRMIGIYSADGSTIMATTEQLNFRDYFDSPDEVPIGSFIVVNSGGPSSKKPWTPSIYRKLSDTQFTLIAPKKYVRMEQLSDFESPLYANPIIPKKRDQTLLN